MSVEGRTYVFQGLEGTRIISWWRGRGSWTATLFDGVIAVRRGKKPANTQGRSRKKILVCVSFLYVQVICFSLSIYLSINLHLSVCQSIFISLLLFTSVKEDRVIWSKRSQLEACSRRNYPALLRATSYFSKSFPPQGERFICIYNSVSLNVQLFLLYHHQRNLSIVHGASGQGHLSSLSLQAQAIHHQWSGWSTWLERRPHASRCDVHSLALYI